MSDKKSLFANLVFTMFSATLVIGVFVSCGTNGNVFNPIKFVRKWQTNYKDNSDRFYFGLRLYPQQVHNNFTNFEDWYAYYNDYGCGYFEGTRITYNNDFEKWWVQTFIWEPYKWKQTTYALNYMNNLDKEWSFTPCGYFDNTRYCIACLQNNGDLITNMGYTLAIPVCFLTDTLSGAMNGIITTFMTLYTY